MGGNEACGHKIIQLAAGDRIERRKIEEQVGANLAGGDFEHRLAPLLVAMRELQ